jgi:hypothetical protein
VSHLLESGEVKKKLSQLPISHENVLIFAFSRLDIGLYPKGFVQRFDHEDSLTYLCHWYSQSRALIDIRIRDFVENKIISYIGVNGSQEELKIQSWDNSQRINRLESLSLD